MATVDKATDPVLIPTAAVRARYDHVSDMWIERRLQEKSGFPTPVYIAKRRYWRLHDLETWERGLATKRDAKVEAA